MALRFHIGLVAAAFVLSGCAALRPEMPVTSYYVAQDAVLGDCYTRIIESVVFDQICVKDDMLRYTTDVVAEPPVMPIYVQAVFEATGPSPETVRRLLDAGTLAGPAPLVVDVTPAVSAPPADLEPLAYWSVTTAGTPLIR